MKITGTWIAISLFPIRDVALFPTVSPKKATPVCECCN